MVPTCHKQESSVKKSRKESKYRRDKERVKGLFKKNEEVMPPCRKPKISVKKASKEDKSYLSVFNALLMRHCGLFKAL
jgi:hypothetical protein